MLSFKIKKTVMANLLLELLLVGGSWASIATWLEPTDNSLFPEQSSVQVVRFRSVPRI